MIHPDFFIDEDVAMLSPWARLLLISLLTQADREGRLEDKPGRIKVRAFPYDVGVDVGGHLAELREQGFTQHYEVDGRKYIRVRNFLKFQKPHPKEAASTIPPPVEVQKAGELPGSALPANFAGVGIRNTESDTESESVTESEESPDGRTADGPDERRIDSEGTGLTPEEEQEYAEEVVAAVSKRRGNDFPIPSQLDYEAIRGWMRDRIPLFVALRGIQDCSKAPPTVRYAGPAVREAYAMWCKAVPA